MKENGIKYAFSYSNEHDDIIIPGDCYENQYNIKSTNGGFRTTSLGMEKTGLVEILYVN